ncbi:putative N-acetyltransferase san [Lasiodiplodia hormozganensis]|uniref:N-acetyltransferase san n=1 Tax=Lasiodiplodia hormozganensis TaxID=869390 RepID=A0AA39Y7M8_9PEZI|nr:putative N-acetyltransferase san [Lasiodiplodia hormozganensis]
MLQTSITKWLSKPKAVTQPDAVQLEPRRPKKTDNNSTTAEQTAKPLSNTTADSGDNVTPTSPIPSQAPTTIPAHDGSTTALGSASANQPLSPPPTTTTITTLPPLSPNITLAPLTSATIPSFRRLNTLLLEIPYPTKFYDEILTDRTTASITLAAFWRNNTTTFSSSSSTSNNNKPTQQPPGILVAGIRCRLLSASSIPLPASPQSTTTTPNNAPPKPLLYIATLSTLSPYRSHGLATHLLAAVTRAAATQHGVSGVCAHVWVANADGLAWYRRRGFEVLRKEEGYYRRLTPSAAWVVWRRVGVGDLLVGVGNGGDEGGEDGVREGEGEKEREREEGEDGDGEEEGERMEEVVEG